MKRIASFLVVLALVGCSSATAPAPDKAPLAQMSVTHTASGYAVTLYRDNGSVFTKVVSLDSLPTVQPLTIPPNHNYVWCRDAISSYDQATLNYEAAVVALAAAGLTGVGDIYSMIAAGTLVTWGTGLGLGGAAAFVINLYAIQLRDEAAMHVACG